MRVIRGLEELRELVGHELGTSPWFEVTQERITEFAECTDDRQWIHCDAERAARESPFGTTIAHGFLTLSLCTHLAASAFQIEGVRMGINLGVNRVRFPSPVPSGSRMRMRAVLIDLKDIGGDGVQAVYKNTFEVEGAGKPCCVAETVVRLYF